MNKKWIALLFMVVLCASVAHAKGIRLIVGAAVDGTIPPAGTCIAAALQLVRDSGVEIVNVSLVVDFDIDTTNNVAYAVIGANPFSVTNFKKLSTVSPISVTNTLTLDIDPGVTGFCNDSIGPPYAFCVLPHIVRYDSVGGLVYPGGTQVFADDKRSIGLVTGSTAVLNSITHSYSVVVGGAGDTGLAYGYDSSNTLSWFGMASLDGASNPNKLVLWRVNKDATASLLQGPVTATLATNISTLGNGNMQVDVRNSYLYVAQIDSAAGTINLRTFDFALSQQTNKTVNSDFAVPGTLNPNSILWVGSQNELVVCTSNFLIVYTGYPFTVKRSIASGCNSPAYDEVNNKLYIFRGSLLTRVNYSSLAQEAQQGAGTGLTAGARLYIDAARQIVYGIEAGGPSSAPGIALAKFDVCSGV